MTKSGSLHGGTFSFSEDSCIANLPVLQAVLLGGPSGERMVLHCLVMLQGKKKRGNVEFSNKSNSVSLLLPDRVFLFLGRRSSPAGGAAPPLPLLVPGEEHLEGERQRGESEAGDDEHEGGDEVLHHQDLPHTVEGGIFTFILLVAE